LSTTVSALTVFVDNYTSYFVDSDPLSLGLLVDYYLVTPSIFELTRCRSSDVYTAQDGEGLTPLYAASEGGHLDVAQFLVEHGADTAAHAAPQIQTPAIT
jgi:ankyrin repeat protein